MAGFSDSVPMAREVGVHVACYRDGAPTGRGGEVICQGNAFAKS